MKTAGGRAFLEWRLSARFTNACFVDDDLMIELTGRLVEVGGFLVTTHENATIVAANCSYDDFGLLEQLISAG